MHEPQVAFTEILGQVIRRRRQDADKTQDIFAPEIDVSASALSRIESGHIPLTIVQLRRIGQTLGVPVSKLLVEAEQIEQKISKGPRRVRLVEERKPTTGEAAGWFLGGAAVGALVTSLMSATKAKGGSNK